MSYLYNGKVRFKYDKLCLFLAYAITKIALIGYMLLTNNLTLWWLLIVSGVVGLILFAELLHAEHRSHSVLKDDELTILLVRCFGAIRLFNKYTVDVEIYEVLKEAKENSTFVLNEVHENLNIHLIFFKSNKAG